MTGGALAHEWVSAESVGLGKLPGSILYGAKVCAQCGVVKRAKNNTMKLRSPCRGRVKVGLRTKNPDSAAPALA